MPFFSKENIKEMGDAFIKMIGALQKKKEEREQQRIAEQAYNTWKPKQRQATGSPMEPGHDTSPPEEVTAEKFAEFLVSPAAKNPDYMNAAKILYGAGEDKRTSEQTRKAKQEDLRQKYSSDLYGDLAGKGQIDPRGIPSLIEAIVSGQPAPKQIPDEGFTGPTSEEYQAPQIPIFRDPPKKELQDNISQFFQTPSGGIIGVTKSGQAKEIPVEKGSIPTSKIQRKKTGGGGSASGGSASGGSSLTKSQREGYHKNRAESGAKIVAIEGQRERISREIEDLVKQEKQLGSDPASATLNSVEINALREKRKKLTNEHQKLGSDSNIERQKIDYRSKQLGIEEGSQTTQPAKRVGAYSGRPLISK